MRRALLSTTTFALIALFLTLAGPVASTARAAGLLTPTDPSLPPLRITDHLVDATIRNGIAHTTVTQTFHNDTKRRLEATYVFPLPEEADLTDFKMSFNGKMVEGRVLPAQEARQIYESIVRQSKDPGLIEFIGRRLLQMRVFPIEPESDTTISVQYQQVCKPVSGMTGYHYPLRTRQTAGQAHGTVRFTVDLESASPLKSIWSPTHAVDIVRDGENAAKIAYEASGGSLEQDFLLLYGTDSTDLGLSVVAHKPAEADAGHFVLLLTPKQLWPDERRLNQDVVFVLDTSGSMAGEKLEQAKASIEFCIRQLDEGDAFSVMRFSTGFDVLYDELQQATKVRKDEALEFVAGFNAAGGTNIHDTLEQALGMRPDTRTGRPFVVVFVTDGMGNRQPEEILQTLAQSPNRDAARIFSFGVGHDVNTVLLDRLSDAHNGHPTYVQPGENLELVLGDFFSVISRPVLTDLKLTLPEIAATERFPAKLGDLYHGQQLILAGRYGKPVSGSVTLTALRNGEQVEYTWAETTFASTPGATYVPALWAGRKIAYLVDQIRAHGENTEMIAEIIALSQEHGIQTPYTSWLVDPERQTQLASTRRGMRSRSAAGPPQRGRAAGTARGTPTEVERLTRSTPPPPGGGGFGGGGGGRGGAVQHTDGIVYGDEFGALDLLAAEAAVEDESGTAANVIARKNAELREAKNLDSDRLDRSALPVQKIADRWYSVMGAYLIDMDIEEKTEIVVVRFGSDAYFDLAARVDLRKILASRTHVGVIVAEGAAVLISDRVGVETLTDEQRESYGIK